jgi:hypothetical protein
VRTSGANLFLSRAHNGSLYLIVGASGNPGAVQAIEHQNLAAKIVARVKSIIQFGGKIITDILWQPEGICSLLDYPATQFVADSLGGHFGATCCKPN